MHPGRTAVKKCPNGESFRDCTLQCKFHQFDNGTLQIYSWELRCLDCGWRSTNAVRSDDEDFDAASPTLNTCSFCNLVASEPGKNLCVT